MKTKPLPGFRDFYPADFALRAHIFQTWRAVAARYGFEEYDGPPLEPLDLYTAKSGDEIVGQLYNFRDKGDRDIALRPEMTPTLARMVASRAGELRKPIRWFSIPQLFRYERQQRGRLREHFQLNCDLIGESGPLADAEIVALAIDCMRAFGLGPGDVRVRLSDRRVLTALLRQRGVPAESLLKAFGFIDKVERLRGDEIESFSVDYHQALLPATVYDLLDIAKIRGWDQLQKELENSAESSKTAEPLREVYQALTNMGLAEFLEVDLSIIRGLAYYTGVVFELFDAGRTLRAICGGGRYDNLLKELGGVDLPALGFGMGDVVLGELLKDRGLAPANSVGIDVFVAFISKEDLAHVLALAHQMRDQGLRVEYALGPQALGKQLKLADARQAALAVVVGPDERARGQVVLRDLRNGTQETMSQTTLIDAIKGRMNG
ncbi:MAG: histidine--tRNA ligase [Gemmatimonadales bacterium]